MEIAGKVLMNLGIESGVSAKSGKEWKRARLVVEIPGQYPKTVALDNMKRAEEFGAIAPGSWGTFQIDVESREYQGRWYTSVSCWDWRLQETQGQPGVQQPAPPVTAPAPVAATAMNGLFPGAPVVGASGVSGLPF